MQRQRENFRHLKFFGEEETSSLELRVRDASLLRVHLVQYKVLSPNKKCQCQLAVRESERPQTTHRKLKRWDQDSESSKSSLSIHFKTLAPFNPFFLLLHPKKRPPLLGISCPSSPLSSPPPLKKLVQCQQVQGTSEVLGGGERGWTRKLQQKRRLPRRCVSPDVAGPRKKKKHGASSRKSSPLGTMRP